MAEKAATFSKALSKIRCTSVSENRPVPRKLPMVESVGTHTVPLSFMVCSAAVSKYAPCSTESTPASAAARTVREGREIFGVSNQPFLDGADALRRGVRFPPLIVMERDADHYILLEGHSRATVYALEPDFFPGTCCFVGRAEDAAALAAWAGAPLDGK